jgi:hypothetical protein
VYPSSFSQKGGRGLSDAACRHASIRTFGEPKALCTIGSDQGPRCILRDELDGCPCGHPLNSGYIAVAGTWAVKGCIGNDRGSPVRGGRNSTKDLLLRPHG